MFLAALTWPSAHALSLPPLSQPHQSPQPISPPHQSPPHFSLLHRSLSHQSPPPPPSLPLLSLLHQNPPHLNLPRQSSPPPLSLPPLNLPHQSLLHRSPSPLSPSYQSPLPQSNPPSLSPPPPPTPPPPPSRLMNKSWIKEMTTSAYHNCKFIHNSNITLCDQLLICIAMLENGRRTSCLSSWVGSLRIVIHLDGALKHLDILRREDGLSEHAQAKALDRPTARAR